MKTSRCALLTALLAVITSSAFGQPADHKITGDAFRGHQARTYQRHARDYSQMLYYEGRYQQPTNPQAAKPHVAAIRSNVNAANKALDKVKESNAAKPEVGRAIDKIKERHAQVIAKCDELDGHVAKNDKDTTEMCDCCMEIMDELDAAAADTGKLLKDLKADEMPKPAKSTAKSEKAPAKK